MSRYLFFLLLFSPLIIAQSQNPQWQNYTLSNTASSIVEEGNFFWLATSGGLVKFNKTSGESKFFNKGNSIIPSNNVFALAVDNDGYKWVGTLNGLVKFKDDEWIVFNTSNSGLPQNWVYSLSIDNDNVKWIGTRDSGLVKFDNINWTVYNSSNSPLPSNYITDIFFKNNVLWIGTASGAVKKTGNDFLLLNTTAGIHVGSIDIDVSGNLWFASTSGLFRHTTENILTQFASIRGNFVRIDNQNVKWFAYQDEYGNAGILNVDSASTGSTYNQSMNTIVAYPWYYSLFFDENNIKWFGSAQGLLKVDGNGNGFMFHTSNSMLGASHVPKMFIDRHDRKWFYTWGSIPLSATVLPPGYLSLFDGINWEQFNQQNSSVDIGGVTAAAEGPLNSMYFSLYEVWGSTNLYFYNNSTWTEIQVPPTQYDEIIYMWYDQYNGDLWVDFLGANGQNNLFIYKNNVWTPIGGYPVYDINKMVRRGNVIWIASPQGLIKYEGSVFTLYTTANSGLPHNTVSSLDFDSDGNLWLGTYGGLVKYDGVNWIVYNSLNSPLTSAKISGIAIDSSDNIYIGSEGYYQNYQYINSPGFVKFNGTEWTIFNSLNSGKPDNAISRTGFFYPYYGPYNLEDINEVSIDNSGKIWIATDGGIGVFDKDGVPTPVELTSFNASVYDNNVNLNWSTATEINNKGFEIQRRLSNNQIIWETIAFITGSGTVSENKYYSFEDKALDPGIYNYRLKQTDYNGDYSYSSELEIEIIIPGKFILYHNYPNPFNPSTLIKFVLPDKAITTLIIYDQLGAAVRTLINEEKEPGYYEVQFNADGLSSGVYFYRLNSGIHSSVKKLLFIK